MIRVGYVGCGRISGLHALGYRVREGTRIEAVSGARSQDARIFVVAVETHLRAAGLFADQA